jgi:hypothetical protein
MTSLGATAFEPGEILWTAVLASAVVAVVFALVPATRTPSRILTAAFGTFAGWLAWNFTLHATHSSNFDTDAPIVRISWADAGSGVLTFVVVALVLGLWIDRHQPASRVIAMAAMAGILALLVDVFVL